MRLALWTLLILACSCPAAALSPLAGPDRDANGIRDDVDTFIRQAVPGGGPQREAAEAYARTVQHAVTGQSAAGTLGALQVLSASGMNDWPGLAREIRSRTVNSGERLTAYLRAAQVQGPELAGADVTGDCQPGRCTVIVFQNGIFTPEDAALNSVQALRRLVGDEVDGQRLQYALNYNPSEGLGDLLEVFRQKFGEGELASRSFSGSLGDPGAVQGALTQLLTEKAQAALRVPTSPQGWLGALMNPASLLAQPQQVVPTGAELQQALSGYVESYLRQVVATTRQARDHAEDSAYMDDNARRLADGLATYLQRDLSVVLVAHSQGNLYAQVMLRELRRRGVPLSRLRVVGIAVPNTAAPGNGTFVSTRSDLVLGALRAVFPVLPANDDSVPFGQSGGAFMGHALVDVYTSPRYPVSRLVRDRVVAAIRELATR